MAKARSWRLSASAIGEFKRCPYAFMLKYVKGIRQAESTESQRCGTNWHTVLEILSLPPGGVCECAGNADGCLLCNDTGSYPDDLMESAVRVLDDAYAAMPPGADPDDWEVEKIKLLYSASAYRWYYANDQINPIVREHRFLAPVPNPATATNCNLRNLLLDGIIDKIVERGGIGYVVEHKSTGSGIDPDSSYWNHLNLDTQTLLYPFMARLLQQSGQLSELDDLQIGGVLYDVYRKPSISPKKLTQGESKAFVESGEYCGQKFKVVLAPEEQGGRYYVNEHVADTEPGKKEGTFALRETPEMYGARLLQDICSRPEFYFARREIARTDEDLARFNVELANIYQMVKLAHSADCWFHNEQQCEATFKCDYIDLCYNGMDPDGELPAGLVRTFKNKEQAAA